MTNPLFARYLTRFTVGFISFCYLYINLKDPGKFFKPTKDGAFTLQNSKTGITFQGGHFYTISIAELLVSLGESEKSLLQRQPRKEKKGKPRVKGSQNEDDGLAVPIDLITRKDRGMN